MNLHFAPPEKLAMRDNSWCHTLDQLTGVQFSDLNPNVYDIRNLKLGLNISTKVKFIANDQGLQIKFKFNYSFF